MGLEAAASVVAVQWKHAEELDGGGVVSEQAEGFGMVDAAWWAVVVVVFVVKEMPVVVVLELNADN